MHNGVLIYLQETARTSSIFALPVSVEQVATVIKQMSPADRQRLLALVPELQRTAQEEPARTVEEARAAVEEVRAEVLQALGGKPLSPEEPFLDDLARAVPGLSDETRARLWDQWAVAWAGRTEQGTQRRQHRTPCPMPRA